MEGSRQMWFWPIQQLAVLGELLVNRALDNIAPLVDMPEAALDCPILSNRVLFPKGGFLSWIDTVAVTGVELHYRVVADRTLEAPLDILHETAAYRIRTATRTAGRVLIQ